MNHTLKALEEVADLLRNAGWNTGIKENDMIVTRFVWFRRGLRLLKEELAGLCREGWKIQHYQVNSGLLGLRYLFVVHLEM